MKLRNRTSDVLEVAALGRRRVAPDEVIEVPDDGFGLAWPEVTWTVVATPTGVKPSQPSTDKE